MDRLDILDHYYRLSTASGANKLVFVCDTMLINALSHFLDIRFVLDFFL